jgi:hypothetical protein
MDKLNDNLNEDFYGDLAENLNETKNRQVVVCVVSLNLSRQWSLLSLFCCC